MSEAMLPFEFVVDGVPRSHQAKPRSLRRAWNAQVRAAAQRRWPWHLQPLLGRLQIVVVYFHEGDSTLLDNDNLLKPVQDALIGLIYRDDRQITDTIVRKTPLDVPIHPRGISRILAEGFSGGGESLYVRIEEAPDHRELL